MPRSYTDMFQGHLFVIEQFYIQIENCKEITYGDLYNRDMNNHVYRNVNKLDYYCEENCDWQVLVCDVVC